MNATINNQSAMPAASTAPAAEPIDYRKRIKEILIDAAEGKAVDRAELKDVLFETGRDKRWFDRILQHVNRRRQAVIDNERQREQVAERERLQSERENVCGQCEAEVEKLRAERLAQLEAEFFKLRDPLRKYDAENDVRLAELDGAQVDTRFHDGMARTADPRIQWALADLSKQLLALQDEMGVYSEALRERRNHIDRIEHAGDGPRLLSRTIIDRDYWVRQRDSSKSMLDDETTAPVPRAKAVRTYHEAAGRLEVIDSARRRQNEILDEQSVIQERIKQLQAQFYIWENFAIDWKD